VIGGPEEFNPVAFYAERAQAKLEERLPVSQEEMPRN